MLLIKVTLPPLDKYTRFHLANLRSIFSRIGFHIVLFLNFPPKGRPKYFIGRVPCLQPRTFNNKSNYAPYHQEPTLTCPNLSLD